jgi:hypothetical protein
MKQLFTLNQLAQRHSRQPLALLLALLVAPAAAQTLTATSGTALTVQSGAVLYVEGGLQNASGATLTNAGTVQLTGDFTNAGTLASAGKLLFGGSQDQTFAPGTASVANLTVANAGAVGSNRVFISADLTVSSLLTLSRGLLRTQGSAGGQVFTLALPVGGQVAGEAPGRYVQGRLQVARPAVTGASLFDFYNGLTLNPNGQNLGGVTVTRTAGLQLAGTSYGQNLSGANKGIDRVWQVVTELPLSPANPATVALSWVSDDDNGLSPSAPAQLWRADQVAGPWAAQGTPASPGIDPLTSIRTLAGSAAQLGTLTVSGTNAPLPVVLTSFTAEPLGPDALLKWKTASERNNDRFEVEVSADGQRFQRIGTVAGHGTTTQAHSYQLTDPAIAHYAADPVYYRLRQVDLDGSASYSPVRAVRVAGLADFAAQLYPNPARGGEAPGLLIRTTAPGPARWELLDALGRTLASQETVLPAGATTLPLAAAGPLATGVYLVRVQQGAQHSTLKLVKE